MGTMLSRCVQLSIHHSASPSGFSWFACTARVCADKRRLDSTGAQHDVAALIMHAANLGIPLLSRDVGFVHAAIGAQLEAVRAGGAAVQHAFDVFNPQTPDGVYPFEPVPR